VEGVEGVEGVGGVDVVSSVIAWIISIDLYCATVVPVCTALTVNTGTVLLEPIIYHMLTDCTTGYP
jgi:hypothetical protein